MNTNFVVNDIVPKPAMAKVIFILESPYKAEIEYGYPVAGLSGKEICRVLNTIDPTIPFNLPFGKYMSESLDNRFGIVNCSNEPMDIKTYPIELHSNSRIKSLDRIRKNPKTTPSKRQNIVDQATHRELLNNLMNRLKSISNQNSDVLYITCGNLAKYFVELLELSEMKLYHIAHPSFNQWRHKKNQNSVEELRFSISKSLSS